MTQLIGAVTRYAYPIPFVKASAADGTHTVYPNGLPRAFPYDARIVALSYENVGGQASNGTQTLTVVRNGTDTAAAYTVNGTLNTNATGNRIWSSVIATIPAGETVAVKAVLANQTASDQNLNVLVWVMLDDIQE